MSLEVSERRLAGLRARAHPLRLRMLSLLTGTAMSAAELARELGVSQALASYHLRQLADAGAVELAEERLHRGGRERRYRYRYRDESTDPADRPVPDDEGQVLFVEAIVDELRRRGGQRVRDPHGLTIDAELWVDPDDWETARAAIEAAGVLLHERARRPHEPGTVHVNATAVLFAMTEPPPQPLSAAAP